MSGSYIKNHLQLPRRLVGVKELACGENEIHILQERGNSQIISKIPFQILGHWRLERHFDSFHRMPQL